MKNTRLNTQRGQAMLTAVVFFLFISVTIVGGVAFSALRQVKTGQDLIRSKESLYISEASVEDLAYRIKNAKNYETNERLTIGDFTASTTVSDISGGKLIFSSTNRDGDVRKAEATIFEGIGASFTEPTIEGEYPISSADINQWKSEASAGATTTGNVIIDTESQSIGPHKIVGNLTVASGQTLTLTGAVWVTGTVTISGGGIIALDPAYVTDSGVLIADGKITIASGGDITGSGQPESYLLLLSTSNASPAISFSSTASTSAILNAQNGTVSMNAGVVKQATGHSVAISGTGTIDYDPSLSHVHFRAGTLSSVDIQGWREVQ